MRSFDYGLALAKMVSAVVIGSSIQAKVIAGDRLDIAQTLLPDQLINPQPHSSSSTKADEAHQTIEQPPVAVPPRATFHVGSVVFPVQPVSGIMPDSSIELPAHSALASFDARLEGRGLRLTLNADILFDSDKATLRPEANQVLQKLMSEVQAHLGPARYRVEGHTDWVGTDAYNDRLSNRRAVSVKEWLIRHAGIGQAHVVAVGFGERQPVAPNMKPDGSDDPENRQKNRRVELVVDPLR